MKNLLAIITFSLFLFMSVMAQADGKSPCPQLSVSGPAGIVEPGKAATYTAEINTLIDSSNIEYVWSVSSGKIISGQGTRTVAVEQPGSESLVVTVVIKGFPAGCGNTASETAAICYCPIPIKLYEFYGEFLIGKKPELDEIIAVMKTSPNDQLHVFLAYKKANPQDSIIIDPRKILEHLTGNGLAEGQITFHIVKKGVDLAQFWRVPPGAADPTCRECEESGCPSISVTGPAGITHPGETLRFAVDPALKGVEGLNYKWSVSSGTIIEGQGKPWIDVQSVREIIYESITAKVVVEGLAKSCPNSGESTAPISTNFDPVQSDEFGKLKPEDEKGRLDVFLSDLNKEPEFKGYIVARFPKATGASAIRKRIKRIKDHIFIFRKIPEDRIVILAGRSEYDSIVLWLLPPKYGESICSECKVY